MGVDLITTDSVRDALRGIRYAKKLTQNPLMDLDCLTLRLREEGLSDGASTRAWVLGFLLREVIDNALATLRPAGDHPRGGVDDLNLLRADFASGRHDREALGAVSYRYLADDPLPVGEIADTLGVVYRTLARRLDAGHEIVADRLREIELEAAKALTERPGAPSHERVLVDSRMPDPGGVPADELKRALRDDSSVVVLSPEQALRVAQLPDTDEETYLLTRVARWMGPEHRLDSRFVSLGLVIDRGEEMPGGRWQSEDETYSDLPVLLDSRADPIVVLLGPPGSGKTTLIRHLEFRTASDSLRDGGPLPYLVPLNSFPGDSSGTEPWSWLESRWATEFPRLAPLASVAAGRGLVLLLDGLNEMPHSNFGDYRALVIAWKRAIHRLAASHARCRVVVTCRTLDYSAPLSSPELRVPHVSIQPLSNEQIRAFLLVLGRGDLWSALADAPQLDLLRNPFNVRLLVEQLDSKQWVEGRAALVTGFVREALSREIERDNPLFLDGDLISERDYRRIAAGRVWASPWDLPEKGLLVPGLARLAWHTQRETGPAGQRRVQYTVAAELAGGAASDSVVKAGAALGLLDEDLARDEVLFSHQLFQEYFAARLFAGSPDPELVRRPSLATDADPHLRDLVASLPAGEALPPLPATGWEEVALLASEMTEDLDGFLATIGVANLALAGACAVQQSTLSRIQPARRALLADALAARATEASADVRERIEAARALGMLGDPRLELKEAHGMRCLVGPRVRIEGGAYLVGSDSPIDAPGARAVSCVPRHSVVVSGFEIARCPVTNAEFAHFMAAGGYEDETWWETSAAATWREGSGTAEAARDNNRYWRARFQSEVGLIDHFVSTGTFNEQTADRWRRWCELDDRAFEADVSLKWPDGPVREPRFWRDARFNHAAQPVVGVTWYEARAYCAWLAAMTGLPFRLPTEIEREVASTGGSGLPYAYGAEFDPLAGNTAATRLRGLAPAGVFPEGVSPTGACDMAANTSDWTSSAWGPEDDSPLYGYPYESADGREDPDGPPGTRRVLRGGSWNSEAFYALAVVRHYLHPAAWDYDNGFRIALTT